MMRPAMDIEILVNGQPRLVPERSTVTELLHLLGLSAAPCAVELNEQVVPRREHGERAMSPGDRIEIVTLVGGG